MTKKKDLYGSSRTYSVNEAAGLTKRTKPPSSSALSPAKLPPALGYAPFNQLAPSDREDLIRSIQCRIDHIRASPMCREKPTDQEPTGLWARELERLAVLLEKLG